MPTNSVPPAPASAIPPPLSLQGVSKRFGNVTALDGVDLDFDAGEIHGVLGENGAGKSTLMNAIYGLVPIDAGTIRLDGRPIRFHSPVEAQRAGIGMVHQEFALVGALTVGENLALALNPAGDWRLRPDRVAAAARAIAAEIGLDLADLDARVETLPVGARQRLEIVKALSGQTRVLILDEPTAVLTPAESTQLFQMLDRLRTRGSTVIFITHKLHEVLQIADRVTVMRRGRVVRTVRAADVTESALAEAMVGPQAEATGPARHRPTREAAALLEVEHLVVVGDQGIRAVDDLSLVLRGGEVLGIAGVDGNGQWELFQVLAGLRAPTSGTIRAAGRPLRRVTPEHVINAGLSAIPPDRQRYGLVLQMSVADNLILNCALLSRLAAGPFLPRAATRSFARNLVDSYAIRTDGIDASAASLSGGNQQRLVVARTLATNPQVLIAFNPSRGLDFAAAGAVYGALGDALARGSSVLLISTDLDEVLTLSDRVAVLYRGALSKVLEPPFSAERLGAMMAGINASVSA